MNPILPLSLLATASFALSAEPTLTIHADKPGAKINPAMWGIFFEDINFGADGGIYAEMVKNRGFEFPDALMGWTKISPSLAKGELTIRDDAPFNPANPHYLRFNRRERPPSASPTRAFAAWACARARPTISPRGSAASRENPCCASNSTVAMARCWTRSLSRISPATGSRITATLHPKATDPKAWLAISVEGKGTVDLDMVSLFPQKTWKNRPAACARTWSRCWPT